MKAALVLALLAGPVAAQTYDACTKSEQRAVNQAVRNAKALSLAAASAVGDTPEYERWFGKYTPRNADLVRANLKAAHVAIRTGRIVVHCAAHGFDACDGENFAFVYSDEAYRVNLCPPFFGLPTMAELEPDSLSGDTGTKEGTFIHEVSHFLIVAATEDYCYTRSACAEMAKMDPEEAILNADSYQYFAEDVTHYRPRVMVSKLGGDGGE